MIQSKINAINIVSKRGNSEEERLDYLKSKVKVNIAKLNCLEEGGRGRDS